MGGRFIGFFFLRDAWSVRFYKFLLLANCFFTSIQSGNLSSEEAEFLGDLDSSPIDNWKDMVGSKTEKPSGGSNFTTK